MPEEKSVKRANSDTHFSAVHSQESMVTLDIEEMMESSRYRKRITPKVEMAEATWFSDRVDMNRPTEIRQQPIRKKPR